MGPSAQTLSVCFLKVGYQPAAAESVRRASVPTARSERQFWRMDRWGDDGPAGEGPGVDVLNRGGGGRARLALGGLIRRQPCRWVGVCCSLVPVAFDGGQAHAQFGGGLALGQVFGPAGLHGFGGSSASGRPPFFVVGASPLWCVP